MILSPKCRAPNFGVGFPAWPSASTTSPPTSPPSTAGTIRFHDWLGDSYGIIFSHPRDFTPVCTTEFGAVAQLADEWKKRKTKVIGVSVDSVADHEKWKRDIEAFGGAPPISRSSTTPADRGQGL
jgi:alkyl hydroperoxide reductase subunit AhpC